MKELIPFGNFLSHFGRVFGALLHLKTLSLLFLCPFLTLPLWGQDNLAPNPSFEEGENNIPSGWLSLNPQKTSIDTVTFRSGKRSLAIFRTLSPDNKPIFAGWESQPIQVEANKEYILEGWVRTDGASGATYLSLAWYKDEEFLEEDISEVLQGDNEWRRLYFISLPPSQATNLRIRFISQGNSGTAYLDDVSLIAHDAKEYKINLAPNPSFEEGMEDKPYDWEIAREWGDNTDFLRSAGTAHSGIYSLSLKVSARGARMAGWKSKGFPVCPGKMYTFTGWAKTKDASGETYLVIAWFNEKGWISNSYHGFFLTGNSDWARLSISDVPPKDATYAILYLRSDDNPGVAWFDDVRLKVSDAQLSEVAVPNPSFETESDFWQPWLSEGHCREIRMDDTFAHEGSRSLMISDAAGCVAWESRGMQLDCNENYQYRLSCWVRTEGKEGGRVIIWIAWFGDGGWIGNSESISAPANSDGWVKLSLIARPPEGARRAVIYLGCEDFQGTAWFDDVKMEQMLLPLDERKIEIKEELPLEYALANALFVLSSGRLLRNFHDTFIDKEDVKKILSGLTDYLDKHPNRLNRDMRFILGILNYHLGNYQEAVSWLDADVEYDPLDIREDIFLRYYYWAREELRIREKEERANEIKQRVESARREEAEKQLQILRQCADDYWDLEMWKEARETYEMLPQPTPDINYRIALSYFWEKNYKEASSKLSDFLSHYPNSDFTKEAKLYLAKSLRLAGNPYQAIPYLKELWKGELEEGFKREVDKEIGKCYMALRDDPQAVEDYRNFFKREAVPGAIYIGSDTQTLGNWLEPYGNFAYILCAINPDGRDMTGGDYQPLFFSKYYPDLLLSGEERAVPPCTEPGQIAYTVYTSDPAQPVAHCLIMPQDPSNPSYLLDPIKDIHVLRYWEDRGEAHPFDNKGPDLYVDIIGIPEGPYRLALFMREHEVRIMDDEGQILAVKPRKEERGQENVPNLYECFAVFGPIDLTIHLIKGKSLCTILSGIFLDKLSSPPPLPQITVGKKETDKEKEALFNKGKEMYEEMRRKWEEDPYWYYQNLDKFKEIIDILQDYISCSPDTTQAILAQFMVWQSYLQLPGGYDEAEEAFTRYTDMYTSAKGK